ncbi:hypothetical protein R3P38DRAFT_3180653 [Favolaschia claudopus]|uniref:Uncharacterized protein n=1 Tax=Favolaschia claudopus TaxID=2862362 RepID=A0AAW0CLD2_9AGAR
MLRGRPPLNPDVKKQNRLQSQQKYRELNSEKLRNAARIRMQRRREQLATSDIYTKRRYAEKARAASEDYRARKRSEEYEATRAARNEQQRAQKVEAAAIRKKWVGISQAAPKQAVGLHGKSNPPSTLATPPHDVCGRHIKSPTAISLPPPPPTCMRQSRDKALSKYSGQARTFTSSTWTGISKLWYDDCEKHHQHSPPSTSPPTPETPPATLPTLPPSPKKRAGSPSKTTHRSASPSKQSASPSKSASTGRRDVSPTKPPSVLKFPTASAVSTTEISKHFAQLYSQTGADDKFELLYAVSGVNRIFQARDRALAVLRRTPGADLIFADNEEEVNKFIEEEALRMRQSGGK